MNAQRTLLVLALAATTSTFQWGLPQDDKEEAIKRDRQAISGTWTIFSLEVDGNRAKEEDARKITVINGPDGTWCLQAEGKDIAKGTSEIDPTKTPKQIDFVITEGESPGSRFHGIYELGKRTRKLCFVKVELGRPTEFAAPSGTERIFAEFERMQID